MKNTEQLEEGKCQEWELILLNILKQIMTNEIALNLGYVKVVEFFDKCEQQAILNERQRIIELITKYDFFPQSTNPKVADSLPSLPVPYLILCFFPHFGQVA